MRIINILGVFIFLYFGLLYNSYRCYIIFINGILFHSNETNIYLRYTDIISNAIITIYTVYNYHETVIGAILGTFFWICNIYLYKKGLYDLYISDIFHVLLTQFILCYYLVSYSI